MEDNSNGVVEKKKSNKPITYGLIGLAVVLISLGLCLALGVFGGDNKPKSEEKEKEEPVNIDTTILSDVKADDFNGVYKAGKDVIKICKLYGDSENKEEILVYSDLKKEEGLFYFEFDDGLLTSEAFSERYVIVKYKDGIGFVKQDEFDNEGNYVEFDVSKAKFTLFKKERDYTKENAFNDFFGDVTSLDSDFTGCYEGENGAIIYTFLNKDGNLQISYDTPNVVGTDFGELDENGIVTSSKIKYTFNGETLVVVDENIGMPSISGTYKKVRKLTMDDVFTHISAN